MAAMNGFPALRESMLPTRDTLHDHARLLGAVRRELLPKHPRWWHISLQVVDDGLSTGPMPIDDGGPLELAIDIREHRLRAVRGETGLAELPLDDGLPARDLGRRLVPELRRAGAALSDPFEPDLEDPAPRYEPAAAAAYLEALRSTRDVLAAARAGLTGEVGPIQLWPHHFDLAFEWFGTRTVAPEDGGEEGGSPTQIGFGFSTGDDGHPAPYYYAKPWPFESRLTREPLPEGACWQTEPWEGSLLEYAAVRRSGGDLLRGYCERVWEVAAPTLA